MKYKSIFISDLHLWSKFSQADMLLDFLKKHKSENLFLVWDIIDGYALKKKFRWNDLYSKVIQEIFKKSKEWTKVYYITWNHDDFLREFTPFMLWENIEVIDEFSYIWVNWKKYLVIHGDVFDWFIEKWSWSFKLWWALYYLLLNINFMLNKLASALKIKKKILVSKYIKTKVKKSVNFVNLFEDILSKYAKDLWYDGVVCWHIHKSAIKNLNDVEYLNCGDFVDSCTAILETEKWEFVLYNYFKK